MIIVVFFEHMEVPFYFYLFMLWSSFSIIKTNEVFQIQAHFSYFSILLDYDLNLELELLCSSICCSTPTHWSTMASQTSSWTSSTQEIPTTRRLLPHLISAVKDDDGEE